MGVLHFDSASSLYIILFGNATSKILESFNFGVITVALMVNIKLLTSIFEVLSSISDDRSCHLFFGNCYVLKIRSLRYLKNRYFPEKYGEKDLTSCQK